MGDALTRSTRNVAVAASIFATAACASLSASSVRTDQHVDRLYFGLGIRDTAFVSDSAWATFVREVVTPKFPQGFTVFRAEGQWRYATGQIAKEPSIILEFIHAPDPVTEALVADIAEQYRKRFDQEAVLRVISQGSTTLYTAPAPRP